MKLAIVIPAYNEEKVLPSVLQSLPKKFKDVAKITTIVVDDGSSDKTAEVAKKYATLALCCATNMGVGTATKIGIEAAKKIGADITITMDADGQHSPDDIKHLILPIVEGKADIAIGTRMTNRKEMPRVKRVGNWFMNLLTFLVFHGWVSDSQSGMKAFSKKAIDIMRIDSIGYEVCSEIIGEARSHKLKLVEIPIQTIYTDYSKSRGQNVFNAINIFTKMISLKAGKRK